MLVRAALWIAAIAVGIWFLSRVEFTLTVFLLAWLIAYMLNPLIARLQGRRIGPIRRCPRGLAVATVYLAIVGGMVLAGALLVPTVSDQINHLLDLQQEAYNPRSLGEAIQRQGDKLMALVPQQYRAQMVERLHSNLDLLTEKLGQLLGTGVSHLASFFGQILTGTLIFLSALLISVYVALGWTEMGLSFVGMFPPQYRIDVIGLLDKMNRIFGGYLRATILTSLAAGIFTTVALEIFVFVSGRSLPYSFVIGLIAGLLYPIPIFGILASTIAGGVLAFFPESSVSTAIWVTSLVFIVNLIVDRALLPKLMSDAMGVSPLFVLFAAGAGGEFLGGVTGMLLGIPLAAMARATFSWVHDLILVPAEQRILNYSVEIQAEATHPSRPAPAEEATVEIVSPHVEVSEAVAPSST